LQEEIPHGLAVEITSWKSEGTSTHIGATIFAEREGHKGIIIGKQGAMLKKIGTAARKGIRRMLGEPVHLELWVKVKKNWRDNDILLRNLGYQQDW
jgi:GTP-binding protein Era